MNCDFCINIYIKRRVHILYSVDMHTTKIEFIEFIIDDMV